MSDTKRVKGWIGSLWGGERYAANLYDAETGRIVLDSGAESPEAARAEFDREVRIMGYEIVEINEGEGPGGSGKAIASISFDHEWKQWNGSVIDAETRQNVGQVSGDDWEKDKVERWTREIAEDKNYTIIEWNR